MRSKLEGSYSVYKGGAMFIAPVGSPGPGYIPFKVAFSNCLQFPLVPPAKVPYQFPFQFPAGSPPHVPLKLPL